MKKTDSAPVRFIVIITAAFLSIPPLFATLSGSVDDSWKFAIHKAKLSGLVFGSDIVFTYGPLGYLTCPLYIDRGLWLSTLLYTMVTHVLFWGALLLFLKRCRATLPITFLAASAIVVYMQAIVEEYERPAESYNYLYLFFFAYGYIVKKEKNILLLAVISLISALFFYVKFSFGIAVCLMFITFIALLAVEKRYREAVLGVVFYLAFIAVSGLIMTGGVGALGMFFYNSWMVADGYVDAMAVDGPAWKFFAALAAWMVYGGFLLRSILRKNNDDMYYLALALGFLFISYKHSVNNGSIFEWDFFVTWGMVFILYYIKKVGDGDGIWLKYAALAAAVLLVAFPIYEYHSKAAPIKQIVSSKIGQIKTAAALVANNDPLMPHEMNRKRLSAYYALSSSTLELIKGHTVDIFTIDAALAGYYELNWHPRPVFQSYSAYTAYLDLLNERFLSGRDAPEFLLCVLRGFPGSSAVLFEPATFRKILTGYQAVTIDGDFWVFRRKDKPEPVVEEKIASGAAPLGGSIAFPIDDRYQMFARIYVEYNIMGKIIRLLFRPPNLFIQLYRGGLPAKRYRFYFNAVNGINLNPFVNEAAMGETNEFAITTQYPGFFDKNIKVEFFRVLKQ
ncbi:MAG: hypothetical protein HQK99_16550 [Nitrospirae bacterium]|nr:hypothetical protein [Nitrospirota bacterium]